MNNGDNEMNVQDRKMQDQSLLTNAGASLFIDITLFFQFLYKYSKLGLPLFSHLRLTFIKHKRWKNKNTVF